MKKSVQIFFFCLIAIVKAQGQHCEGHEEYRDNYNITLSVSKNGCSKQWGLTSTPTTYAVGPYCDAFHGCYQYDLFKNGVAIQQALTTNSAYTFAINYDSPGVYSVIITTKYNAANSCDGYWVIVMDHTQSMTLTSFCIPDATYSNVNSGNASLALYTRTTNYILTQNTVTVNANSTVQFYSQGTITLSPGFTAQSNSAFNATIQTCTDNATCQPRIGSDDNSSESGLMAETELLIYPNPASGTVTIVTGNLNNSIGTVELLNTSGEKILTLENNAVIQERYQVNTDKLPNGLYLIKIRKGNKEYLRKLLLVR